MPLAFFAYSIASSHSAPVACPHHFTTDPADELAVQRLYAEQNLTVLRHLGSGKRGVVRLVQLPDGQHAAMKQSVHDTREGFVAEALSQQSAATAGLAPRVLGTCVSSRQLFAEVMDGGPWVAGGHASACAADSAPTARHCHDLSRLLAGLDEQGILQRDWKLAHLARDRAGTLKAIDYSAVDTGGALPPRANWCSFVTMLRPNNTDFERELWRQWTSQVAVVQCVLRCLLELPAGPLDLENALRLIITPSADCSLALGRWYTTQNSSRGAFVPKALLKRIREFEI